jgi:Tol biopolymer transport system component
VTNEVGADDKGVDGAAFWFTATMGNELIRRAIAAALLVGSASALWATAASARPVNGRIAFTSNRSGHFQIYSVCPRGFPLNRLTRDSAVDSAPAWSPNGRQIAFVSNRSGHFEIYVMNADGHGVRRLTSDAATANSPAWSPDGHRIAFVTDRTGADNIYVMNADGSGEKQLTNVTAPEFAQAPAWSPDGRSIAFDSDAGDNLGGPQEIFAMPASGGAATQLSAQMENATPAWSPNGREIAFVSNRTDPSSQSAYELYVMDADGSRPRELTFAHTRYYGRNFEDVDAEDFSPDSKWIVFSGIYGAGYRYVAIVPAGGGIPRIIAASLGLNGSPSWGRNTSGCSR